MADPIRMPDPRERPQTGKQKRKSALGRVLGQYGMTDMSTTGGNGIDELLVPEGDNRRATVEIRARVSPELNDAVEKIVASKLFPWTTISDFVRSSVYWMVVDISEKPNGEMLRSTVANLRNVNAVLRQLDYLKDQESALEHLERQVRQCLNDGDLHGAKIHLSNVWSRFSANQNPGMNLELYEFGRKFKARFLDLQRQVAETEMGV